MSVTPTGQTETAESGRGAALLAGIARTVRPRRVIFLAVLTATNVAVLWYGFSQGSGPAATMPAGAGLLWLVIVFFAGSTVSAGIARRAESGTAVWARLVRLTNRIPIVWYSLGTACLASFVIGQVANSQPPPRNYWPLFALWLVSLGSVVVSIAGGLRLSEFRPTALKERLWPYRWEVAAVAALTVAAATVRIVILTSVPMPFEQDEAAMAHEALHVLEGATKNMFMSGLQGHPTMQFFAESVFLKIFGVNVFAIRLISAVGGTLGIPLLYLLLRQMFGRPIAFIGAAYLVGYHLHLAYSRIGMENVGDPLLVMAVFYFAWRASREGKTSDFVLTGLVMGLGLYLYQGSRVIPLVVAAFFGYCVVRRPAFLRQAVPGAGLMALAYGAAAFPLTIFWFTHQADFMDRINVVGIFQSHWIDHQQAVTGKSTLSILWDQSVHSFGAFGRYADRSQHYLAPIPFVDRLSLLPFLLGVGYSVYKVLEERYLLLLAIFVAIVITGGVLTIEAPTSQRLVGTSVVVAAFVAIGVKLIADAASRWRPSGVHVVAGVGVSALLIVNIHFYFWDYRTGGYYTDFNTYVAEQVVDYAKTLPKDTKLFWYGDPVMYLSGSGHPSMTFPLRDYDRFDVMKDGKVVSTSSIEGDTPATFMFMAHRQEELQPLVNSCPGGEMKTFILKAGRRGLNGVQKKDEISFIAYEVLSPNNCLPVTAKQ